MITNLFSRLQIEWLEHFKALMQGVFCMHCMHVMSVQLICS